MSDNASVTPANDSAVIQINLCVYQAIVKILERQPELLRENNKQVSWRDTENQIGFTSNPKAGLSFT